LALIGTVSAVLVVAGVARPQVGQHQSHSAVTALASSVPSARVTAGPSGTPSTASPSAAIPTSKGGGGAPANSTGPGLDACHSGLPAGSGCAVDAWGYNVEGFVGDGTMTERDSPVIMDFPSGTRIKQIAAGSNMSEALEANGTVWSTGRNYEGEMGNGTISATGVDTPTQASITGVASIAAGQYTVYALKNDGTVWAWGFNGNGALGNGSVNDQSLTPVQVAGLSNVVAVAGEQFGGLALRSDGTVWAWGYNANGELGNGTTAESTTPVQVQGLTNITAISGGQSFGMARRSDGTVWAWGSDSGRQLGISSWADQHTPVEVLAPGGGSPLTGVIAIATGSGQALALRSDGSLVAWGYNGDGEVGNNNAPSDADPTVVLTGVRSIAAGWSQSLALKQDGTLWAWGSNTNGALGIGTSGGQKNTPVQVHLSGTVIAIAGGQGASMALIS